MGDSAPVSTPQESFVNSMVNVVASSKAIDIEKAKRQAEIVEIITEEEARRHQEELEKESDKEGKKEKKKPKKLYLRKAYGDMGS